MKAQELTGYKKRKNHLRCVAGLFVCLFLTPIAIQAAPGSTQLEFVENKGQWAEPFLYKANAGNSRVYLEKNGFTYIIGAESNIEKLQHAHRYRENDTLNYHAYKVIFENAGQPERVIPSKIQSYYNNYFLGNDASRWKSGIHPCLNVDYKNLYAGIDLHVSSEHEELKYDLIAEPGADVSKIAMRYEGTNGLKIKNDILYIETSVGTILEMKPYAYQDVDGRRAEVKCKYKLKENTVSFSFPDGYDKNSTLVIDPKVVFATFTGSSFDNWGYTATYDSHGNFYAGGITGEGAGGSGYPVTTGAIQTTYNGGSSTVGNGFRCDMAIMKINPTGNMKLYATYLGGISNEQPHSMVVDANDNLVIAGRTYSPDFPHTANCFDSTYNDTLINVGGDMIICKFNSGGTSLLASTLLGGKGADVTNDTAGEFQWGNLKRNYGDDARSEVIVDKAGNIYVAACTRSKDFPTTASAIKSTLIPSDQDAVVVKMNSSLTAMIWGTYIGGGKHDAAYVLALDTSEKVLYVAGGTMSTDFLSSIPGISGGLKTTPPGGIADGFIIKFNNGGTYQPLAGTYIGADDYDQCYGIQVDIENNVYAMGQTLGGKFETTYVPAGAYKNAGGTQFVIKLNSALSASTSASVFGSGTNLQKTNISPVAFLVDSCLNVYISGWGGDDLYNNTGFAPPPNMGTTHGLTTFALPNSTVLQNTTDGKDMYFIVYGKNMNSLQYATFRGQNGGVGEHVDGGTSRFDKSGIVYQAICGGCGGGGFPTEPGNVISVNNGSNNCNQVALKIAFEFSYVAAQANASPSGIVCLGRPITFSNGSTNATNYEWNFGDGSPINTQATPTHAFNSPGTFQVRMIAINPNACKPRDTVYLTFVVDTNSIKADFDMIQVDSCKPYTATFTNRSKLSKTPANTVYTWDFGDGTTYTGTTPPMHYFPDSGYFTVTLRMTDPTACNSPDSVKKTLHFNNTYVKTELTDPGLICVGRSIVLNSNSQNATSFLWTISNGYTTTTPTLSYKFDTVGNYRIKLVVYNPLSCNKVDSGEVTIQVKPMPTADFTHEPVIPITNMPVTYTNKSKNATDYTWSFGDGSGSKEINPVKLFKRTGSYSTCLYALNEFGCADTICRNVDADVFPLADVPTAFSPNGDGSNDILYVRGSGIETVDLKIFNRWGQLVFETKDINVGWDGTYKGKPQEMEGYAFTLSVKFIDETTFFKKGNITLLR